MKKSELTKKEIIHLAKLANLTLTEEEIQKFAKQLSSVVDYIGKLNEVDTKEVEEISQVTGLKNVKRADKTNVSRKLKVEEALKNARSSQNNMFKVKAIFQD